MAAGVLVILSGPSGVGKDTVIDHWRKRNPKVERVVAYTTRMPRPGEQNGVDYHFVPIDIFREMAAQGAFLEFKEVHGNLYATPIEGMEALLSAGKIAILKIDVQGALTAMKLRPEALTIFLAPPSAAELENRIKTRGTDDPQVIEKRLRNAREEMALADQYQHVVVNDDLARVIDELERLVS